jgi:GH15 family glucan-1,4-alpha-glucosidase
MPIPIEDYALIGDTQTAALVGHDGSIDWACFPRFDSAACFSALLGDRRNGRWMVAPSDGVRRRRRRYRLGTLVLETELSTATGTCRLIDFMPIRGQAPDIVRLVEGIDGEVEISMDLVIRFDTGRFAPWVRRQGDALTATGGPDGLCLRGAADLQLDQSDDASVISGRFKVRPGERRSLVLTWFESHADLPAAIDPARALDETESWWRNWSAKSTYRGPYEQHVATASRVLKALTYAPSGGIVAAPTTSLPEWPGGVRNWDYRYCWLRDATMTLYALLTAGYREEAVAWREWLLRATAGNAADVQIMYGIRGERRLREQQADWLGGYEGSRPVRLGNAAYGQVQLDVYGEVLDALFQARRFGIAPDPWAWGLELGLLGALESKCRDPDHGMWEIRGEPRPYTFSKVMAWVAFDRGLKSMERFQLEGPHDRWRRLRAQIHDEVCARAFDRERSTFTMAYDRPALDSALLLMPMVGFLPADDPRFKGTVSALERELMSDGFLFRYRTDDGQPVDGLPPCEGAFLPCTLWLADAYVLMGRQEEAVRLFERVTSVANDVGLLSEEYDPARRRLLGNFPQALTHLGVVNTAFNLAGASSSPARHRHSGA